MLQVAEESGIVSEITFGETSTGAAVVSGAYVGHDQSWWTFLRLITFPRAELRHQSGQRPTVEDTLLVQQASSRESRQSLTVCDGVEAVRIASLLNY